MEAVLEQDLEQVFWGRLGEYLSLELSCVNRQTPPGAFSVSFGRIEEGGKGA